MWVNLLQAVIKPGDNDGAHPADVTAGKMGVTKTVSASLPAKGFEPVIGLVKQLHAMDTPIPPESILASVAPIGPTAPAAPATEPPASTPPVSSSTAVSEPSTTPSQH